MIKVTVWNEFVHEQNEPDVAKVHPNGIHATLAEFLSKEEDFTVRTCTLHDPEHGLTQEVLDDTDVLIWWGHKSHNKVEDEIVERVYKRVIGGMGLIALHSAHHSKIFKKLMGTTCNLRWRHGARCRVWVVKPSHPIAQGVDETFSLPQEEMYGEPFDVPNPDDVVFMSWFNGGEVSVPAAPGPAATARSSTSSRATSCTPLSPTRTSSRSLKTPSAGQNPPSTTGSSPSTRFPPWKTLRKPQTTKIDISFFNRPGLSRTVFCKTFPVRRTKSDFVY